MQSGQKGINFSICSELERKSDRSTQQLIHDNNNNDNNNNNNINNNNNNNFNIQKERNN